MPYSDYAVDAPRPSRSELIGPRGFGVEVRGESLADHDIHDGDEAWVNPDLPVEDGHLVLVRMWDVDTEVGMMIQPSPIAPSALSGHRYEGLGVVVWIQPAGFAPGGSRRGKR